MWHYTWKVLKKCSLKITPPYILHIRSSTVEQYTVCEINGNGNEEECNCPQNDISHKYIYVFSFSFPCWEYYIFVLVWCLSLCFSFLVTVYTVVKVSADFVVFNWWRYYCKVLCDVKFSQIGGNGRKFSHIELSNVERHQLNFLTV